MDRRDFLKKSSLVLGGLGVSTAIHPAILKALSIKPQAGSTFYDAEHVVILMQENRSFDHCFGSLKGVRGFRDKYAFRKPNGKSVFFQTDHFGQTYAPFHLDIKNTKSTWMRSLPHSWENQQHALNKGKYDQWLNAKKSGIKEYQDLPLSLGFYNRIDLPFYYQLADAFTVFDQYFCSSLTGTTPNRLFHWTGTNRAVKNGNSKAHVINDSVDYDQNVNWKTFPELLEEHNVSWRIYQNEISLPKGLSGEQDAFLSNFTDNPIEFFSQYNVKFSPKYFQYAQNKIEELELKLSKTPTNKGKLEKELAYYQKDVIDFNPKNWERLSDFEKRIHDKAFTTNNGDPDFWNIEEIEPVNGQKMFLPKGDILHQFRKDVDQGKLPMVSWLVAPERYSDHPGSQWYGAWYISEIMNILTKNPDVWRKTIFILNYDENDGYFDHVVPFLPPQNPHQKPDITGESGAEFVNQQQQYFTEEKLYNQEKVEGPVGLGFRVPMIIASPWSMGGFVNSEVSDHTSVLQFLETFINKKHQKNLFVDHISSWRRAICGDLTSAFNQANSKIPELTFLQNKDVVNEINEAKDKPLPHSFRVYDIENQVDTLFAHFQEKGVKPSNALDYYYDVNLKEDGILLENWLSKAAPLLVYDRTKLQGSDAFLFPYTLFSHDKLIHGFDVTQAYDWEIFGPNGYYRNFFGKTKPLVEIRLSQLENGDVKLQLESNNPVELSVENFYTQKVQQLKRRKSSFLVVKSSENGGWYDLKIKSASNTWVFSGRVETGQISITDPHWA